ncbi:MAG: pyridoxine 5'-phosphate synthase, partial [Deltaproteobacteria bacterium]
IQERDVRLLREVIKTRLNLEMAANEEIINIALQIKPDSATIVPEKRQELTTEGGLDVIAHFEHIEDTVEKLRNKGIIVSLFVDPEPEQIKAAAKAQADFIEIHTGTYAEATEEKQIKEELNKIIQGAKLARELGLRVNAGHGLNYRNVRLIAQIEEIEELNIGHSIISRAIMVGITQAVKEMKILLEQADYLNQKV